MKEEKSEAKCWDLNPNCQILSQRTWGTYYKRQLKTSVYTEVMSNVNGICTYYYTITIVFLSSYSKAKTVLGMLCRDKSIIALIIGQYMKYRPRKRPRRTSVFYSFYISYIDLFNRAIIDIYSAL